MSLDLLVNNRGERNYFGDITGSHTQFCTLSQILRQQVLESNGRKKEWDARGRHPPFFLTPTPRKHNSWTFIRLREKLTDGEKTWKLQRRAGAWTNFEMKKAFMQCFLLIADYACARASNLLPGPLLHNGPEGESEELFYIFFLCAVFTNKVVLLQAYYEFWWGCCNYVRNIICKWMKT